METRAQGAAPKVEILLVKYNQPDLEADTIRHILDTAEYPNYSLRAHQVPRGKPLSQTWNELIAQSDAEYICLINTDTIPTPGWLRRMVAHAEAGAYAVVPSSNRVHMSQIEVPFEDSEDSVPMIRQFALDLEDTHGEGITTGLPTCSAMCVLFPRSVWEVLEGFDEEFTFYGEDTHFFYRVTKILKGTIVHAKGVYVHHLGSQSFIKAANNGELDYAKLRQKAGALWQRKKGEVDDLVAANLSSRKHQ